MARAGGRRRSTRAVVVAALLLGSLAVLVRLASAHHAEVTASAACGAGAPVVRWTAIAWQTSAAEHRVNNDVRVQAYVNGTWQEIATGAFNAADNYQFTGTYALPASVTGVLYLQVVAVASWGATGQFGSPGEYRQTTVDLPSSCASGGGQPCGGSLGVASDYNLFVRGNVSLAASDVGGRVAVGGDASFASYGIGTAITASSSRIDLAVDGTLTGTGGVQVGSGSVTYGGALVGAVSAPNGLVTKARAPYVANAFAALYTAAHAWLGAAANGAVAWSTGSPRTLTLTGTDAALNVWTLSAADLQSAGQIRVNAPQASTMLVNVTGAAYDTNQAGLTSVSLWNGTGYAQYGYPSSDTAALAYRTHLLWNFAEATSVQIGPGLAWEGSVLAPYATVRLTGGAALNGSVIAAAATTGGSAVATELHPYAAAPPCLPPTGATSGTTGTTVAGGSTSATTTAADGPTTLPAPPTTLSPYCITYGDLSGTVFEDHDANGVRDPGGPSTAVDGGVGGVTVKAFDAAGAAVGVATSGADGTWRMNVVHSSSRDVRIEFSGLPAGYLPGSLTTTGGTVQFVSLCDQGVDLAVEIPTHYCQDNPDLAASCQRRGASTSPVVMTQKWGAGWNATAADSTDPASEYNTGYPDGRGTTTAHPVATPATDVGSVSALAWRPSTRTLYAAAYVKAATVMGPGGPGAVYAIPVATSGAGTAASVAVTLPAAAGGAPAIGPDGTPSGFDDAGRTGLGGVAVVSDPGGAAGDALYVVGLADRLLYRVTNLDAASKTVTPLDLPLSLPGAAQRCATVDVRPFGLTTWDGVLYAALTCTAESTRDAGQVRAYVYGYTPATGWTATPALELPLTYDRGLVNYWGGTPGPQQHWLPWSADGSVNPGQALVTDLAVTQGTGTAPGALIVGLRSRAGDRVTAASDIYWSGGDVLLAPRQGAGWVPEPGLSTTVHSEYFLNDGYPFSAAESTGAQGHLEAARGAVAAIPGYRDVAVTQLTNWWTSGIGWHSLATGRIQRALSLYRDETGTTDTFGKTNSLGDLVALCDQAPIEIGDRVWADANDNGIQDVGEFGLAGVQVELRAPAGIVLATTVTDGLGQYVFRGLLPRTGYRVWVDLEQPVLAAKGYREAKAGLGADRGLDNDASRSEHWVVAAVTSRNPGDNDHSIDIGLAGPPGDRPRCSCATTTTTAVDVPLPPPPPKPTYVSP